MHLCMETNFVDLVKPVGEEDDHKQKQNKENNTKDSGGRRVSAKDVRDTLKNYLADFFR